MCAQGATISVVARGPGALVRSVPVGRSGVLASTPPDSERGAVGVGCSTVLWLAGQRFLFGPFPLVVTFPDNTLLLSVCCDPVYPSPLFFRFDLFYLNTLLNSDDCVFRELLAAQHFESGIYQFREGNRVFF